MGNDIFSAFSSDELKSAIDNTLFRRTLDIMPVAVAVLERVRGTDGIDCFAYIFANNTAERMAGKALPGNRIFLNDDALLFNSMSDVVSSAKRDDFVYHYQKDPEQWIHYSISRFGNGVIMVYENITERKKAERALTRERERMAEAQAICNAGSFEWDLVSDKIHWSDEMYRIHNLENKKMTAKNIFGLTHSDDVIRLRKKIEHYSKTPGREEIIYKVKLPGGQIRHLRTVLESFRGQSGKVSHISGMTVDITERKCAEDELRAVNELLKKQSAGKEKRDAMLEDYGRIIASVHEAIISIDTKGYVVTWNAGAERLYGYNSSEAIGRHLAKLIIPDDKQEELSSVLIKIFKKGESFEGFRTAKKCKDEKFIAVIVNIVPLKDASGRVTGACMTSTKANERRFAENSGQDLPSEITEIKADIDAGETSDAKIRTLNKSLTEKNRELRTLNNQLKTFTSVAAYDYKDTLQNLYTNLEFIISRDAQNFSNAGKANLRKAQTAIQKMKLLTDDIVEFSNIRRPDESPSEVDLNTIVKTAAGELAEKISGAQAVIETDELPVIQGYPFLLNLLFYHLLDNAIKFRSPDGEPTIKIAYHMTKDKSNDADMHQISISDHGMGIAAEDIKKVFDMFYRNPDKRYKGSGTGLSICKKIAELHGGTMAIESEIGKGTIVCCFFPIA